MIKINSLFFTDEFSGVPAGGSDTGVPYLMGNVGDLIWATIDLYVQWSTLNSNIDFNSANKTIIRKDCGAVSGSFITDGFQIGDTITITDSSTNDGTYTVTAITNTIITVLQNLNDASDNGVNIYGVTLVTYFDFYYNLIGNTDAINYTSLTDSKTIQKFSGTSNPYYYGSTFALKPNATSLAWWDKKVNGVDAVPVFTDYGYTADHKQHFKVVFPFLITPLFKAEQLALLQNSFAQSKGTLLNTQDFDVPDYFKETCLKFIYQIDAKFKITNTKIDHSSSSSTAFVDGNTAWYNTFYPTGVYLNGTLITKQQYDLVSIAYTDNSAKVLSSIDIANITNVSVKLKRSGTDSVTNEKFVVNFMWLPTDTTKYKGYSQNNQADFRQAFLHDRCKSSVGAGATNGDQFGTTIQALTTVVGSAIDADNFQITFKVDFGSLSKSTLTADAPQSRNYLIWITPRSTASTTLDSSDQSAVICDVNQAFLNTDDSTLLTVTTDDTTDTHYFKFPNTNVNPLTDFKGYVGEVGLMRNNFKVKSGCIIENIKVLTEVKVLSKPSLTEIGSMILETYAKQTGQFYNGTFTDFSVSDFNGYALPVGDIRNTRQVNRTPNMDTPGYYSYELIYGFQLGYQYWQTITQFPDQLTAFHSQYWAVYSQQGRGAGDVSKGVWIVLPQNIKLQITHTIKWDITDTSTGVTTEFEQVSNIYAYDNISNASGNTIRIDTQSELGESLEGIIASDSPTVIVATLAGSFTIPEGSTEIIGELAVYYQDGNQNIYDAINTIDTDVETTNSVWTELPTLIFDSTKSNGLLFCTLDFSNKINIVKNIVIYAKISYKTDDGLVTDTTFIQLQTDTTLLNLKP